MDTQELLRVLKTLSDIDVEDMVPLLTSIFCDGNCLDTSKCKHCKHLKFIKDLRFVVDYSKLILKEVK
jgi:hypothetical protein